jgi:hypothetical protein
VLESLKNKWWRRGSVNCVAANTPIAASSSSSVLGIFYVLLAGLGLAVLVALVEYSIESRRDSLRLRLTWLGQIGAWMKQGSSSTQDSRRRRGQESLNGDEQTATLGELRRLSRLLPLSEEMLMQRKLSAESAVWLSPKRSLAV